MAERQEPLLAGVERPETEHSEEELKQDPVVEEQKALWVVVALVGL